MNNHKYAPISADLLNICLECDENDKFLMENRELT